MNLSTVNAALRYEKSRPYNPKELDAIKAIHRILGVQDIAHLTDRELQGVMFNLRASLKNLNELANDNRHRAS